MPKEAVIVDDTDPSLIWSDGWDPVLVSATRAYKTMLNHSPPLFAILDVKPVGDILWGLDASYTDPRIVRDAQV